MTSFPPFASRRALSLAAVVAAGFLLAACTDYGNLPKELRPLSKETSELVAKKGMTERSPILVRIFKEESALEVWKREEATGRYALLKGYEICRWSGELGPKLAEGDRQAPEGFYAITPALMNPKSSYYLSFNLGFPNAFDRANDRTGTYLMVHGACSSAGCYSMTDEQIQEIYSLGRLAFEGGQRSFQVQAYPFRMTPENLARQRNNENMPFWRMLKEGSDYFETTGQEPKIDVCDRRYVFNATSKGGPFNPTGPCPPMSVPPQAAALVAQKDAADAARTRILVAQLEADEERVRAKATQEAAIVAAASQPPAPETVGSIKVAQASTSGAAAAQRSEEPAAYAPTEPRRRGGVTGFLTGIFR